MTTFNTMQSRYAGKCTRCDGDIARGETIAYSRNVGAFHPDCVEQATTGDGLVEQLDTLVAQAEQLVAGLKLIQLAAHDAIGKAASEPTTTTPRARQPRRQPAPQAPTPRPVRNVDPALRTMANPRYTGDAAETVDQVDAADRMRRAGHSARHAAIDYRD